MKSKLFLLAAAIMMCGCEKPILGEVLDDEVDEEEAEVLTKKFTFTMKGDFTNPVMRGYLSADGKDMTDLWVFDFADGVCVQTVHQTPADESFGKPSVKLTHGSHHVYFVASRGESPVVDDAAHTVTWEKPSDTFWTDYEVTVTGTSNGNRAVTLGRVATKMKVTVLDEIPQGCSAIAVKPSVWYYGLDFVTGEAVSQKLQERVVTVPASYVGTSGQLTVSIFGLSPAQEWESDVSVRAMDADGNVMGSASIVHAPFVRNRSTEYSGCLFATPVAHDLSLSTQWSEPSTGTF